MHNGGKTVADPGEGPGSPLVRPNEARKAEKNFLEDRPPPLSKGLDDRPPPLTQGLDPALS